MRLDDFFDKPTNDISEAAALEAWRKSPDDVLRGNLLGSAECSSADVGNFNLLDYLISNPQGFVDGVRVLPLPAGELLCRYIVLGLTQQAVADILKIPQTKVSQRLAIAERAFAAVAGWNGPPSEGICEAILRPLGRVHQIFRNERGQRVPMFVPQLITEYGESHSYELVAAKHKVSRIDVRRHLRSLAKFLSKQETLPAKMLGAWLTLLVVRSKAHGSGYRGK